MKLRVGVIGLGADWQRRHCPALRALSDRFEVRAICEQVSHRAELAAKEFGAEKSDGYQSLIRRDDIDAILLLSPQWYGVLPIFAACEAGKAIYCAAMTDMSVDESATVRQCVDQAGIAFMVEFPRRLAPATLRLKELIATQLGEPRLLFCHYRETRLGQLDQPHGSGVTRELVELVDWCSYVVGRPVKSLLANACHTSDGHSDYQMLSLDFAAPNQHTSSTLAQLSYGSYIPHAWPEANSFRRPTELQVCCEHGIAYLDLPSSLIWFNEAGRHIESLDTERPVGEQLFSQFHRAVTSLVRSTSDLEQSHHALDVVLAADQSYRSGRRIECTRPSSCE